MTAPTCVVRGHEDREAVWEASDGSRRLCGPCMAQWRRDRENGPLVAAERRRREAAKHWRQTAQTDT